MIQRFQSALVLLAVLSCGQLLVIPLASANILRPAEALQSSELVEFQKQATESAPLSDDTLDNTPTEETEIEGSDVPLTQVEGEAESVDGDETEQTDEAESTVTEPTDETVVTSDTITDEELNQFANVLLTLESLQDSYRSQSITIVQSSGLSLERFDQLLMMVRSPNAEGVEDIPEATTEETEQFQLALIQIGAVQTEIQEQAQQAILDEGFEIERFQAISDAVTIDPALESQVRQFMETNRSDPS